MSISEIIILILKFFNDNIGLVTLIVGGVAIYLYTQQKKDYKRDAASIILMEIRHAEKIIDQLKQGGSTEPVLLPTNNWTKYNYLFIKDLDRERIRFNQ